MFLNFFKKNFSFLTIIVLSSLYITILFNYPLIFFLNTYLSTISENKGFSEFYYLFTLWFSIFSLTFIFFIIFAQRKFLLKFFIIFAFILGSVIFYFRFNFNVIVDDAIVRSTLEAFSEKNYKEIKEILSFKFFWIVLLTGIFPSIIVYKANIHFPNLKKDIFIRIKYLVIIVFLLVLLIVTDYKNISLVTRTIKKTNFNYQMIPHYSISSTYHIFKDQFKKEPQFEKLDHQPKFSDQKKIIGVVVVGETARASSFSLNGYIKKTNPELENENIYNYNNAFACGTLTNISVPCMFYIGDYKNYNYKTAKYKANAIDVINQAGADVTWIENNSSCKNVCNRVNEINFVFEGIDPLTDEELVKHLIKQINQSKNNKILVVLHSMGSHGPAYYKRVPDAFAKFKPYCKKNNPQECTTEEIVNAYDNTILYTDYFLKKIIETLKGMNVNSFMLYASDHGESLGEHGIYLHGLPLSIAPKEQIHIPFIFWLSEEYKKSYSINIKDVSTKISHENFPHTLMSLMGVESKSLKDEKSLITVK